MHRWSRQIETPKLFEKAELCTVNPCRPVVAVWRELLLLFKLGEELDEVTNYSFGDEGKVKFKALLGFTMQDGLSKDDDSMGSLDSLDSDDFSG